MTRDLNSRVLSVAVYAGGRRLSLDGYRVYLNYAEAQGSRDPNKASVTIANLGKENRGLISGEHQAIEIIGGYTDNKGKIFQGSTTTVEHTPPTSSNAQWETVIEALDGVKEYQNSWVSNSWPARTPLNVVATDLAGEMGLPSDIRLTGNLQAPWAVNGRVADALTELCEDISAQWSIYQGVVEVLPETDAIDKTTRSAVVISAATGMIGVPHLVDREPRRGKKRFGVAVKCWMDPRVRPTGLIQIKTDTPTAGLVRTKKGIYQTPGAGGFYRVARVSHFGGLHTNEFQTELETESFYA